MISSQYSQRIYYQEDIEKAFDMGLEVGVDMLESMIGLSSPAQRIAVDVLKKKIHLSKIKAAMIQKGPGQLPL